VFFVFNDCAYWFFAVISIGVAVAIGGSSVSAPGVPVGVAVGMGGVPSCADTDGKVMLKLTKREVAKIINSHLVASFVCFIRFLQIAYFLLRNS
jgi:hypothetical protein